MVKSSPPMRRGGRRSLDCSDAGHSIAGPDAALLREVPVRLMGFDVIEIDGETLTDRSWVQRREVLESIVVAERSRVLIVPKAFTNVSPVDMLEVASSHGMEGLVLKPLDSPYVSGRSDPGYGQRSRSAPQPS